jgi:phosphoglycerol transferase MdoB-like AlkP superfamily enzyme
MSNTDLFLAVLASCLIAAGVAFVWRVTSLPARGRSVIEAVLCGLAVIPVNLSVFILCLIADGPLFLGVMQLFRLGGIHLAVAHDAAVALAPILALGLVFAALLRLTRRFGPLIGRGVLLALLLAPSLILCGSFVSDVLDGACHDRFSADDGCDGHW